MGWGTTFTPEIYLNRLSFDTKYDLEQEIEDIKDCLSNIEKRILMISAARPEDICGEEFKDEPLSAIQNEVTNLLEEYQEDMHKLVRLELFLIHLEDTGEDIKEYNPFKDEKY